MVKPLHCQQGARERWLIARRDALKMALASVASAWSGLPIRLGAVDAAMVAGALRQVAGPPGAHGAPVAPGTSVDGPPFTPIAPSSRDELLLAAPFSDRCDRITISGEEIAAEIGLVGEGCDYLAFLPIDRLKFAADLAAVHRGFCSREMSSREGLLVVNHEGLSPRIFHESWAPGQPKSEAQLLAEMRAIGLSVLHVTVGTDGRWHRRRLSPYHRRVDAQTWCELTGPASALDGGPAARGTLANCAGGVTPWGTVLSCEENFHEFTDPKLAFRWPDDPYRLRHYGWVVEVDPFEPRTAPRKHTAMGRFRHESVALRVANDGTLVGYMGDDLQDACLYKFVADGRVTGDRAADRRLLESGRLYAADVANRRWLLLDFESQPLLQQVEKDGKRLFLSQADVLADARSAALAIGATPLARPEDVEVHPRDGSVFVALTNHKKRDPPDLHGRIVRLVEQDGDPRATTFAWSDFAVGGPADESGRGGFSCPDNLAFDDDGSLWVTCDVAPECLGKPPYAERGNNGLFFFRTSGPLAGRAWQFASGPVESELTGPCFTPDGSTLFLSVQHPGEQSPSRAALTSHWPEGGNSLPRSGVVAIRGFRS